VSKALAGLLGFAARLLQAQHRDQLLLRSAALATRRSCPSFRS
jgi:hypothetical protein